MSTLTFDMLRDVQRVLKIAQPDSLGLRVFVTPHATKKGRRFIKPSRYRSARILKKLLQRHGGYFESLPAIYRTPHGLFCHPALYHELMKRVSAPRTSSLSGNRAMFAVVDEFG